MVATAALIGITAAVLGDTLVNVAGEVLGTTLYQRYRQYMVRHQDNHDLQRAVARSYTYALQALYRRYLDEQPRLTHEQRQLLNSRYQSLAEDLRQIEQRFISPQSLLDFIAETPESSRRLSADLLRFVRARHCDGAPAGFVKLVEQDLYETLRFFLWEELKVDERAQQAFQNYVLAATYRDMQRFLDNMGHALPAVRERLDAVAPQARQLVETAAIRRDQRSPAVHTPVASFIAQLMSDDLHERSRAAQELLVFQGDEAVDQLEALLKTGDETTRLYAILILASVRPALVIEELVRLASREQPVPELRRYAANRLASLRDVDAIAQLAVVLAVLESDAERESALNALTALGKRAVEPLALQTDQLLSSGRWEAGRYAAYALHQIAPAVARPRLRLLAQHDPNAAVRAEVSKLLH